MLVDGVALRQPPGGSPEGILGGRRALVIQTFNAPATVDKVLFFYAPKLLGGDGKEMVGSLGINRVARAIKIHKIEVKRLGDDVVISGYIF